MTRAFHERLERAPKGESSSNRSFGLIFAVVFAAVGLWPLFDAGAPRLWALIAAGLFLLLALVMPAILAPLNRAWLRLADLLQKIISPIVLALLFFSVVMPVGLIMRFLGKDLLRLEPDPEAESYWIQRSPPGPPPATMDKQF
jgi:hypothetical protein